MSEQYYLGGWDDGKQYVDGTKDRGANVKKCLEHHHRNHSVSIAILDTGKALKPAAQVSLGGRLLVEGEDYTLSYRDNVNVGRGMLVVSGMGNYKDSVEAAFVIDKGMQKFSVKTKDAVLRASALSAKAKTVKCLSKVTGAKGKVAYKKTSGAGFLSVDKKTGKIKVKKGAKAGVYTAQVAVTATGTGSYNSATKTAFVTVVVK